MKTMRQLAAVSAAALGALLLSACGDVLNNPYPSADKGKKIIYEFFNERPKHFDPASSYNEGEAYYTYQIYEPLFHYHYLKRPYTLEPNVAAAMPTVTYLGKDGSVLSATAKAEDIAESVYEIKLKPGIVYQPHPAFAKDEKGAYLYFDLDDEKLGARQQISDFEFTGTRPLSSEDYAYQLKRMVRPKLYAPAAEVFKVIVGLEELDHQLAADAKAGKINPDGWIDLRKYTLAGVETPDPLTLRIRTKGKYPQFIYWLAMTFVVPMPWEAERFFAQPGMAKRELTLDMWPVGTGPFMMTRNEPNRLIVLDKNPNYRHDTYPCEGEPADKARGLLDDCGKKLPLVDSVKFIYEREAIPFWNKFMQGYFDQYASTKFAGLASFDSALQFQSGGLQLTESMKSRGITMLTEVEPSVQHFAINMLDPVVGDGGQSAADKERARKVRQAIGIALDIEEYRAIIGNGLGIAAQGPIPPGLPGVKPGKDGINPYQYDWVNGRPKRKSVEEAKKLLVEAGYPEGRDAKTGEPLIIYFDAPDSFKRERLELLIKQFKRIDIQLVARLTDFNRFQQKHREGNVQMYWWGWNADFPDPENFFFLFLTKQGKFKYQGENTTNYSNAEFDALYEQFKGMDVTADRQPIIDRMVEIVRRDAPWFAAWHDESFELNHPWFGNTKPGKIIKDIRKYQKVDVELRDKLRAEWNRPTIWPLFAVLAVLAGLIAFGIRHYRRHENARALPEAQQ